MFLIVFTLIALSHLQTPETFISINKCQNRQIGKVNKVPNATIIWITELVELLNCFFHKVPVASIQT